MYDDESGVMEKKKNKNKKTTMSSSSTEAAAFPHGISWTPTGSTPTSRSTST